MEVTEENKAKAIIEDYKALYYTAPVLKTWKPTDFDRTKIAEVGDIYDKLCASIASARRRAGDAAPIEDADAARLQADLSAKASAEAQAVIENAHKQAEMDTQREKDALKGEFTRLVAEATSRVTGKVLSDADHRAINAEAIKSL